MESIIRWLKQSGYGEVDGRIYRHIDIWRSWYTGKVKDFHCYRQYNGKRSISRERRSMGMAKTVAEDWANLLLNERVEIEIDDQSVSDSVHAVLDENDFRTRANQLIELTFALGTGAFVEFLDAGNIVIDYIRADMIYPLREVNGRVIECAFGSERVAGETRHVYLNIHRLDERGLYVIENHLLKEGRDGGLYEERLPEGLAPVWETGSSRPMFQLIRPNIVNNITLGSPMGISCYANAIDQLQGVDLVFDSWCNEFRLGKKRIIVPLSYAQVQMEEDGVSRPVFDDNDTEFYAVNLGENAAQGLQDINMEIRSDAHETGLKTALNALSVKCGMGSGRYRLEEQNLTTATQVISTRSELYQNVRKHEILLRSALDGLCRAVAALLGLRDDFGLEVQFDDSIIEDTASERQHDLQEVSAGLMQPWEFRARWYGEDEETAKKATERAALRGADIYGLQ